MDSILNNTKSVCGISEDDTSFDSDILTHINDAVSDLSQLGILSDTVEIIDASQTFDSLNLSIRLTAQVKSYLALKTRMLFDPPSNQTLNSAMNAKLEELQHRMLIQKEIVEVPSE